MRTRLLVFGVLLVSVFPTEAGQAKTANDLKTDLKEAKSLHSWVDLSSYLPTGTLTHLDVFVDPFNDKLTPVLRIQIWSRSEEDEDTKHYSLKWEKLVSLTKGGNRFYKIQLKPSEMVAVNEADKLGWTTESNSLRVSAGFDESYGSLFYVFKDGDFPKVGRIYTFDGLIHPQRFSITPTVKQAGSAGVEAP